MDLLLDADDLAFRTEVRGFLRDNISPHMRRAIDLTTGFIVEPDVLIELHRALHRKGWSVSSLADRTRRHRLDAGAALHLRHSNARRAGAPIYNGAGQRMCRAGHHEIRHAGAEGKISAAHQLGRRPLVPGLFRARLGLRPRLAEDARRSRTATTTSSTARRSGRRSRTSRTACSRWCAPRPKASARTASPSLCSTWTLPGITVRPIIGNGGDHEFNEVFFDDVRVPKSTASARRTRAGRSRSICWNSSAAARCTPAACARNSPSSSG